MTTPESRPGDRPDRSVDLPDLPEALADLGELGGTADLLRGVLRREAEAVRPSSGGLDRILAAAHAAPARPAPRAAGTPSAPGTAPAPGVKAVRGPSTVELPAVSRPAQEPPAPAEQPPVDAPAPEGGRLLRFVPRGPRRRSFGGWAPIVSAAAAVVALAGGLGAVRVGAIQAPGLVGSVVGARQPDQAARKVDAAAPAQALPVYLVSRQQGRWALVREFAATTISDPHERLEAALRLAVAGTASDPDLTSVWADLDLNGEVSAQLGDELVVRLSPGLVEARAATGATDLKERQALARLAVAQLVWTATAVVGRDAPVRIESTSVTGPAFLGVLTLGRTFSRGVGEADPRAPVWISTVADGQRFAPGEAVIGGDAVTTESGTVEWTLTAPDGGTAATGSQRLVRNDGTPTRPGERGNFQLHLSLTVPGTYRLTVLQRWLWAGDDVWTETKSLQVG